MHSLRDCKLLSVSSTVDEWALHEQAAALLAVGMLDYCQLRDHILIATAALVEAGPFLCCWVLFPCAPELDFITCAGASCCSACCGDAGLLPAEGPHLDCDCCAGRSRVLLPVLCHEWQEALRRHSIRQGLKCSMRKSRPRLCMQ